MCDDDWVKLAMADDSKVVHLLLLLHQPSPPAPHLHLNWTVRQHRSRSLHRIKADPTTSTRASPTTPLSWTGATSESGGAVDGYENSSHPTIHAQTSRSKIANPSNTTTAKKSRRKKTLAELKKEENLLLQERKSLKNELTALRLTVEKHRATNESLKRIKLDLESRWNSKSTTTTFDDDAPVSEANASSKPEEIRNKESTFIFPDLNLPVEDDLRFNAMH
ncbi:hypothetical protein Lal_00002963 [Lupinus albus]|uniref:Putative transcription factor bZIP family n=1 Tax=Lupinus albus TaxID=3870 RepID=A0A6A5NIM8_LUPAL|nr:putative transcription factor bZIP family [Lupinus albus]KAF1882782.1 hypothetical protein Lal_00002963 [Lupinus albus]